MATEQRTSTTLYCCIVVVLLILTLRCTKVRQTAVAHKSLPVVVTSHEQARTALRVKTEHTYVCIYNTCDCSVVNLW